MVELKITLAEKLELVPPVLALLAGDIPDAYGRYKLRHPGGIFNIQFGNVTQDLEYMLEDLGNFMIAVDPLTKDGHRVHQERITKLLRSYTLLLFSFENYLESAHEILLAFCPGDTPPGENEPLWRWFKGKGYTAGYDFYRAIKGDVQVFKTLFNRLKHRSNRLRLVLLELEGQGRQIVSYYLEASRTEGAIGPDETLHPTFEGVATANSFNRDLRILYFNIYKIADVLETVLQGHYKQIYSKEMIPNVERPQDDSGYRRLLRSVQQLGTDYLPNEFGADVPYASVVEQDGASFLVFDVKKIEAVVGAQYRLLSTTSGDGFSRTFRFPYFRPPSVGQQSTGLASVPSR